jgi:hypothetical protein
MKIKIIKDFRPDRHSNYIETGLEVEARRSTFDVFDLETPYQIIDGEHAGKYVPYENCIRLPDQRTYTEKQYTELKQANLMHVENEKAYERKINSLVELVDHKHREITRTKRNLGEINTEYGKLRDEHRLLLVTIEQDMDHQSVVLPKEVAEAIEKVWSLNNGSNVIKHLYMTNWNQIGDDHGQSLKNFLADYAKVFPIQYMTALVDGYTVEQSSDEKVIRGMTEMIREWLDVDDFNSEDEECERLAVDIHEFLKGINSKH